MWPYFSIILKYFLVNFLLLDSIIHTYALNKRGGVAGNFTVTILESGKGSIIDPEIDVSFKENL